MFLIFFVPDSGSPVSRLGISWSALQAFCIKNKERLRGKTTLQVRDEIIKELTASRKSSYSEVFAEPGAFGPANLFVSHAWSYNFMEDLIDGLSASLEQQRAPSEGWFLWIDIFVVCQWVDPPKAGDSVAAARNFKIFSKAFSDVLKQIGRAVFILSPWDRPVWMERVWCLFEFYVVWLHQLQFEFIMPPSQSKRFLVSLGEEQSDFLNLVSRMDIQKASAYSQYDADQIKGLVQTDLGGFSKLNESVICAVRDFCVETSKRALRAMSEEEKSCNLLLENTGDLLSILGDPNAALEYLLEAQRIKESRLGTEDPSLGQTYRLLGVVSNDLGKLDDSLKYHQKSLEIDTRCFGTGHVSVADTYNNMGIVFEKLGDYEKALFHHQNALDIKLKSLGGAHVSVADTYRNIGVVRWQQGDYENALLQYQNALEIYKKSLGDCHVSVATTYNNMGIVFKELGDYEKALFHYQKALDIMIKSLGGAHVSVAGTYNNMGSVYQQLGNYEKALFHYQNALDIKIKSLGGAHVSVAMTKENIALVYIELGQRDKAKILYQEAHEVFLKSLGPTHFNTLKAARGLAQL